MYELSISSAIAIRVWMSNYIQYETMDVITHWYFDFSLFMWVNWSSKEELGALLAIRGHCKVRLWPCCIQCLSLSAQLIKSHECTLQVPLYFVRSCWTPWFMSSDDWNFNSNSLIIKELGQNQVFVVMAVVAYGLAPLGARAFGDTVMTIFMSQTCS